MPTRSDASDCGDVSADDPTAFASCVKGSGHAGRWVVDAHGLPAYDFALEERCDPAATAYSPRAYPLRDPIHQIGNGRGLVAMAHASGGVEIYMQDRGHAWVNHVDPLADGSASMPPQLGGGFSYVVDGGYVGSTRFEDLPIASATTTQTRRFGMGYVETETDLGTVHVRRRVFAPDAAARALVSEVTLENPTSKSRTYELVEVWDPNLYDIRVELVTSDVLLQGTTDAIEARRRAANEAFVQRASYDSARSVARLETTAKSLPPGITSRVDPSDADWFPDPLFLATLDPGVMPDAVYLVDDELFEGSDRAPPAALLGAGDATARTLDFDGAGQHAFFAMRVAVSVPAHATETRRFAFGYVPGGGSESAAVDELRVAPESLASASIAALRDRLVFAAFPGLEGAGAIQRELAWGAYSLIANVTFDETRGLRFEGQGGSYKYIHGLDGAIGDYCLLADAVSLIDPSLARDTLAFAIAQQHASTDETPGRYPYATTGVQSWSDVSIYKQRSDPYWLVPSSVGAYVATSRDAAFLDRTLPFWPPAAGETDSVREHLVRGFDYADTTLDGVAARGLLAIGSGDYADGILQFATPGTATATGASSTFNAGLVTKGLPLAADVVEASDAALATRMRAYVASQRDALLANAIDPTNGWFHRAFADDGSPIAADKLFLEPQVLPVVSSIVTPAKRGELLGAIEARLETALGAITTVDFSGTGSGAGGDQPQVGGVWPVANAWLTEAYAREDAARGWDSFTRNTLFHHAELFPDLWYGIWTGPDSFFSPDAARPGEADAHYVTALTDYPAFNMHVHAGPMRALMGLLGIEGTRDGITIAPRVPVETFNVQFPTLGYSSRPDEVTARFVFAAADTVTIRIAPPAALRTSTVKVTVNGTAVASTWSGSEIVVTTDVLANAPITVHCGL